jgi:hypothetical protein
LLTATFSRDACIAAICFPLHLCDGHLFVCCAEQTSIKDAIKNFVSFPLSPFCSSRPFAALKRSSESTGQGLADTFQNVMFVLLYVWARHASLKSVSKQAGHVSPKLCRGLEITSQNLRGGQTVVLALSPSPAIDIIESSAWLTLCSCLLCAAALSVPHGNFSRFSGSCRTLLPNGSAVLV